MTRRKWSKQENDFLLEHYLDYPGKWCAEQLGRTVNAVRSQAQMLNVSKRTHCNLNPNEWTKKENDFLRKHYKDRSGKWCAEKLGRTVNAVRGQAQKLHVTKRTRCNWDKRELEFLKDHYPLRGAGWCADRLNRTLNATRERATLLGLRIARDKSPKFQEWNQEDDQLLCDHYPEKGVVWCADHLRRPISATRVRANHLGLKLKQKGHHQANNSREREDAPVVTAEIIQGDSTSDTCIYFCSLGPTRRPITNPNLKCEEFAERHRINPQTCKWCKHCTMKPKEVS